MSVLSKQSKWSPKNINAIASLSFMLLIIFNKASYKIPYLEWLSGGIMFLLMSYFFIVRGKILKQEALLYLLPIAWMGYALLITPFTYDAGHHLSTIVLVLILNLIVTSTLIPLFSNLQLTSKVVLITSLLWLLINLSIFLLWLMEIYTYEMNNYAGIFQNRNEFAIQTIILIGLLLNFTRSSWLVKLSLIIPLAVLVLATLSLKGFVFLFFVVFYPLIIKTSAIKKLGVLLIAITVFSIALIQSPLMQDKTAQIGMVFSGSNEVGETESVAIRYWLLTEGIRIAMEKPLTGVGVDNAKFVLFPPYMPGVNPEIGLYSHINYVELALNAGVVGLVLFYLPLFLVFLRVKKTHPYSNFLKTFILLYLFLGFGMVQYDNFISIIHYTLILFIFLYYKDELAHEEKDTLPNQHA